MSKQLEVNERIRATQVRLIDENGNQKGIKSLRDALFYARSLDLDLVKIADSTPPVVKVVDAGKYAYDLQKQQKEHAKKQRATQVEVKEIQLRPVTDINDIKIKAKRARGFLDDGDKVRVVMRFRGREVTHKEVGMDVLAKFMQEVGEAKTEQPVKDTGRDLSMVIAPIPQAKP